MATLTTKVTRKGQITIPVAIRDALDMHEGDIIVVKQVDNEVVLQRADDVVDWTAGYLRDYAQSRHLSPEEIRKIAAQAIADQVSTEIE